MGIFKLSPDGVSVVEIGGPAALATAVYITNLTGSGTITNKTYEANTVPSNHILTAAESDNDDITVVMEIRTHADTWQPASVTVSGAGATPVTVLKQNWTQIGNEQAWTATANLTDADTTGTITATMSDGDTATLAYTRALDPPLILTAIIDNHPTTTGGDAECPLAQTQVSGDDQIQISGTAEAHCTHVYVKDFEVTNGEGVQGPFTIAAFNAGQLINVGTGDDATANYKVYGTVGTGGTPGADFTSTESIDKDNTSPNLALSGIVYPASQAALSDAENAQITVTDSNRDAGDSTLWDDNSLADFDDGGNAAIANSEAEVDAATYDTTSWNAGVKWVERQATGYRDSGTNVRVTATRVAKNGKAQTLGILVKIAHDTSTIDITNNGEGSPKVFRSKTGADKTYTITITSDQELEVAPTLARDTADSGTTLGAFSGGPKVWTATLTTHEADTKNVGGANHDFESLVARNNADKTQTTINSGSAYRLAGFEQRDVAVLKFDTFEPIGTMVSNRDNPTNLVMEYVGLGSGTYVTNTADDPGSKKFTIVNSGGTFDAEGDHIKCNDSNIYDAVDYTMRIEESA